MGGRADAGSPTGLHRPAASSQRGNRPVAQVLDHSHSLACALALALIGHRACRTRADYTVVAGPRTLLPMALPQQRTDSPSVATTATAAVSPRRPLRQLGGDTQGRPPGDSWGLPPSKVGD